MNFRRIQTAAVTMFLTVIPTAAIADSDGSGGAGLTSTPYSVFGLGDLMDRGISYNFAMGGTGIADRDVHYINVLNPAAVTAREAKSFMFDFGVENRNTIFDGNAATSIGKDAEGDMRSASNTFNMHHIVASFPIYKSSAFKLGIIPYSNMGYNFIAYEKDDDLVAEVGNINYQKVGEGQLYQAFIGAGVTFWDRLSIGADAQYYFGDFERYSMAYYTTNTAYRSVSSGWSYIMSGFSARLGLQYEQKLGKANKLTIGATYNFGTPIKGYKNRYAFGETSTVTDTVVFEDTRISGYSIPAELGVALNFSMADTWKLNLDYTYQDWTGIGFDVTPGVDYKSDKAQSFRVGFEYTPNRYDIRYYLRRVTYRAGAYHKKTYVNINGRQVTATGITLGVSFPIPRYYNAITFGVDFGQKGNMDDCLIRERYFLFNLSFDLYDFWFIKNLYN